jgi:hypothetical protein
MEVYVCACVYVCVYMCVFATLWGGGGTHTLPSTYLAEMQPLLVIRDMHYDTVL